MIPTWWVGLIFGVPLALACRAGGRPKVHARDLVRPLLVLLLVTALAAFAASLVGYALAHRGTIYLIGRMAHAVPSQKHSLFIADLWVHTVSYAVGFLGGVVLLVRTIIARRLDFCRQNPNRRNAVSGVLSRRLRFHFRNPCHAAMRPRQSDAT